jgi:catechol 2,3-dioxygenase-like lactoylglutathione lyase family enzyme
MSSSANESPGRILGIGGIFMKSANRSGMLDWYRDHLGIQHAHGFAQFHWRLPELPNREHQTVWSIFPASSEYFDPSGATFMVNYIVDDLDALLEKLNAEGVRIDPKRDDHAYGRFAWIYDPDGNKIELWQPLGNEIPPVTLPPVTN